MTMAKSTTGRAELERQAHRFIQTVLQLDVQGLNRLASRMTTQVERWGEDAACIAEMATIIRDMAARLEQRTSA